MKIQIGTSKPKKASHWKNRDFNKEVIEPLLNLPRPVITDATTDDTNIQYMVAGETFSDFENKNNDALNIFVGTAGFFLYFYNDIGQRYLVGLVPEKDKSWVENLKKFKTTHPVYVSIYAINLKQILEDLCKELFVALCKSEANCTLIFNRAIIIAMTNDNEIDFSNFVIDYIKFRFKLLNHPYAHLLTPENFSNSLPISAEEKPILDKYIHYIAVKKPTLELSELEHAMGIRALHSSVGHSHLCKFWLENFSFHPPTKFHCLTLDKKGNATTQSHHLGPLDILRQTRGLQENTYVEITQQKSVPVRFLDRKNCELFHAVINHYQANKIFDSQLELLVKEFLNFESTTPAADKIFIDLFIKVLDYIEQNPSALVLSNLPKKPRTAATSTVAKKTNTAAAVNTFFAANSAPIPSATPNSTAPTMKAAPLPQPPAAATKQKVDEPYVDGFIETAPRKEKNRRHEENALTPAQKKALALEAFRATQAAKKEAKAKEKNIIKPEKMIKENKPPIVQTQNVISSENPTTANNSVSNANTDTRTDTVASSSSNTPSVVTTKHDPSTESTIAPATQSSLAVEAQTITTPPVTNTYCTYFAHYNICQRYTLSRIALAFTSKDRNKLGKDEYEMIANMTDAEWDYIKVLRK